VKSVVKNMEKGEREKYKEGIRGRRYRGRNGRI